MTHECPRCVNSVDGPHQSDRFGQAQHGPREATKVTGYYHPECHA
jgi:hypothetical protein